MNEIEKRLKKLLEMGYESVSIMEILQLIRNIRQDAYIKRHKLNK